MGPNQNNVRLGGKIKNFVRVEGYHKFGNLASKILGTMGSLFKQKQRCLRYYHVINTYIHVFSFPLPIQECSKLINSRKSNTKFKREI